MNIIKIFDIILFKRYTFVQYAIYYDRLTNTIAISDVM